MTNTGYEPEGAFLRDGVPVEPSEPLTELLRGAALCSDARLVQRDGRWQIKGDPTEGALVVAAAKAGLHKADLDAQAPRVSEIPFTSETKRMTTLHTTPDGMVAYAKGAPEIILDSCAALMTAEGERALGTAEREAILATARQMAGEALRVLAVARKPVSDIAEAERELTFLGLVGMIDPPRPEAQAADRDLRAGRHSADHDHRRSPAHGAGGGP